MHWTAGFHLCFPSSATGPPSVIFVVGPSISGQQVNSAMDHCAISASVFHKLAGRYRDTYMGLTMYDDSYRSFCALIQAGCGRVLDAAWGPGTFSRSHLAH